MQAGYKQKFLTIILFCICLINLLFTAQSIHANPLFASKIRGMKQNIEFKRTQTRKKIRELKVKENFEINKLSSSQAQLEDTTSQILVYQRRLDSARIKLVSLESKMHIIGRDQEITANKAGERIKQIYKGERIGILHLIFEAQDINSFLDRVYYQKRLAVYDKNLLIQLRVKTRSLETAKYSVLAEKNNVLNTINSMNEKKKQIAVAINVSHSLITKLRTDRATYEAGERDLARQSSNLESLLCRKLKATSKQVLVRAGFSKPLSGYITSPFGWRRHPIFGSRSFHSGVDIAAPNRSTIRAANTGRVIYTGWYGGYGKVVIINLGQYRGTGTSTLYAHLSRTAVAAGQSVKQGEVIGYEGTTGYSTGPHLHFEVRLNGKPTNPLNYIP